MKIIKDKSYSGKLETYIGDGTSLEGNITSKDNLTVYGNIKGTIESQGHIVIGESGTIQADIVADEIVISGKILGNITAKTRIEITSTGLVKGDIKTARLIMEDGCKFDGYCEMLSDSQSTSIEKVKVTDASPAITPKEKQKLPSAQLNTK